MSLFSTIGKVGGTALGFGLGGPAGAVAGYRAGSALGGYIDEATSENQDPAFYDSDPDRLALQRYRQLMDPSYGAAQFDRLAGQASIGAATANRAIAAQGGSVAQGTGLARQSSAEAGARAFDAFSQFRSATDAQAQSALGLEMQRAQFQISGASGADQRNADRNASFLNSVISSGAAIAGTQLGGGGGANAMTAPAATAVAAPAPAAAALRNEPSAKGAPPASTSIQWPGGPARTPEWDLYDYFRF